MNKNYFNNMKDVKDYILKVLNWKAFCKHHKKVEHLLRIMLELL